MENILNDEWNRNKKYDPNKNETTNSITNNEVTDKCFCETCSNLLYIHMRKKMGHLKTLHKLVIKLNKGMTITNNAHMEYVLI